MPRKGHNLNMHYNNKYNKNNNKFEKNKEILKLEGVVTNIFPGQKFEVKFENGHKAIGTLAGKLTVNSITLYEGDVVVCEIPVSNISTCRIVFRKRSKRNVVCN